MVGRASPGGPVDDLTLTSGRWATRPGQVVLLTDGRGAAVRIGTQVTVTGVPGSPHLTVVGTATSITHTAQAWVAPAEIAALRAPGTPEVAQMLYRFASAGTTAQVNADVAAVRAALPPGALLGAQSWLTVKLQATGSIAPWVPFIVAFGLIGLVMSVLIVANVVSGAVVAGDPPDRRAEVHRVLARPGGGLLRHPGGGPRVPGLRGRRGGRQPAVRAAARPDRAGLRRGRAGRAGVGRRGGAAGHAGPGRPGRAAAGAARGTDERGAGHRDRAGAPASATGTARTGCSAGRGCCRGR